jgi:ABC-type spermidine/putrescine transport system permease subunit II
MSGDPPVTLLNTWFAVLGGLTYSYFPFMVLPIYAALEALDPRLIEAGKDLYGGRTSTFRHVTWPMARAGVIAGCVLVFLPSIGDFATAQLLGGPRNYMLGNLIADQFGGGDWTIGAAMTVVVMSALLLAILLSIRRAPRPASTSGSNPGGAGNPVPGRRLRRSRGRGAIDRPRGLWVCTWLTAAWLFLPIAVVVIFSFNQGRSLVSLQGFGLRWYREVASDPSMRGSLAVSLQIALETTAVATVLGTFTAFGIARSRSRWARAVHGTAALNLVAPEIATGVALLLLFTQINIPLSNIAVVLGHVTFCIPFVAAIVGGRLAGLSDDVEEAALDLGATRWGAVRYAALPLLWPAIIASSMLAFVLSFDDFVTSFFLSGVGTPPLPVRIYSMLRFGVSPAVNAIGTFMIAIAVTLGLVALVVVRGRGSRRAFVAASLSGR